MFARFPQPEDMKQTKRFPLKASALVCWNWKCALMSAVARSVVYLLAMAHGGPHNRLAVAAVEMGYVTLTAGLWAGLQQMALGLRSRLAGNFAVALVVPALSQLFDWLAHRATGATAPPHATLAVCIFAGISALFHLHVMRRGAFLSGHGRSLAEDFRRIPRLTVGFALQPLAMISSQAMKLARIVESEAAY
jgi:hypothetical protein